MWIGPYQLKNNLILAPMAGVSDRAYRKVCHQQGAAMVVSEMVSSNPDLASTRKSQTRINDEGENGIRALQIVGVDALQMAEAARHHVDLGAQIIDINMGCPAKKVCNRLAGSALLKDEHLVGRILNAVVSAVSVPVTLKIRTGWDENNRNGVRIARIAEDAGIQMLAVHGRTRACRFKPTVEYETIRQIKLSVTIPVIANGDIDSGPKAAQVLETTGADGLMIGRASNGRPWIFRQIAAYLQRGETDFTIARSLLQKTLFTHLDDLYSLYGIQHGVRIARKHIHWYLRGDAGWAEWRSALNQAESVQMQGELLRKYFDHQEKGQLQAA